MGAEEGYKINVMISKLRKAEGLTQKALGEKLGMSEAEVKNMEDKGPNIKTAIKVARFFNVSLDFLLTGSLSVDMDVVKMTADIVAKLDETGYLQDLKVLPDQSRAMDLLCENICSYGSMKVLKELMADGSDLAARYFTDSNHVSMLVLKLLTSNRIRELASDTDNWPWPNGIKSLLAAESAALSGQRIAGRFSLTDEVFATIASDKITKDTFSYLLEPYDGTGSGTADVYWVYGFPYIIDKCYETGASAKLAKVLETVENCNSAMCDAIRANDEAGGSRPRKGLMACLVGGKVYGYTAILERTIEKAYQNNDFLLVKRFNAVNQALCDAGIDAYTQTLDEYELLKAEIEAVCTAPKATKAKLVEIVGHIKHGLYDYVAMRLCTMLESFFKKKYGDGKIFELIEVAFRHECIDDDVRQNLHLLRIYRNKEVHEDDSISSWAQSFIEQMEQDKDFCKDFLMKMVKCVSRIITD